MGADRKIAILSVILANILMCMRSARHIEIYLKIPHYRRSGVIFLHLVAQPQLLAKKLAPVLRFCKNSQGGRAGWARDFEHAPNWH